MKGIVDIEELALEVRDKKSRLYIVEAISAFKSGAYRAAIISIWIAIVYDIISKLRELSESKDAQAKKEISKLDNLITRAKTDSAAIKELQELERNYLKIAFEDFEFINQAEYNLLVRVKEDRNLCAHPAFIDTGLLFEPIPELVKSHLLHSINFLLKHKPVQGKAALDEIIRDLKKLSFPKKEKDARVFLRTKYFNYAKPALINNLTRSLITGLLNGEISNGNEKLNVTNTLSVLSDQFHDQFEEVIRDKIPKIINDLEDRNLWNVIVYLSNNQKYWKYFDKPSRLRIKEFLSSKSIDEIEILNHFTSIEKIDIEELDDIISNFISTVNIKVEKAIDIYGSSRSFAGAAENGKTQILPIVSYFRDENIKNFIEAIMNNKYDQIIPAAESEDVLEAVFDANPNRDIMPLWVTLLPRLEEFDDKYLKLIEKIRINNDLK